MQKTLAEQLDKIPLQAPAYLSPSSIETFQICPLKYKLSRIDGIQEPPTEATVLGNYVHDALEELLKLDPSERTEASAKALLSHLWTAERDGGDPWGLMLEAMNPDPEEQRKFRWRAWWCVETYFTMETPSDVVYGGLETPVQVEIDGVAIKGFVDRWDINGDGFDIVDYKTGKAPAKRYQAKKFQQLLIYAAGLQELLDLEPLNTKLLFVKDGITLEQGVTSVALRKTKEMLRDTRDQIDERCASGHFEPVKNGLCERFCHFKRVCPLWN